MATKDRVEDPKPALPGHNGHHVQTKGPRWTHLSRMPRVGLCPRTPGADADWSGGGECSR